VRGGYERVCHTKGSDAAYISHYLVQSCFLVISDGPRKVVIGRSAPERAWLEDGDVLTCTADSNPPSTYHWTELTTGVHLHKGAELVLDACRMLSESGWHVSRREVLLLCTATANNHSNFSTVATTLRTNKRCAGLISYQNTAVMYGTRCHPLLISSL